MVQKEKDELQVYLTKMETRLVQYDQLLIEQQEDFEKKLHIYQKLMENSNREVLSQLQNIRKFNPELK